MLLLCHQMMQVLQCPGMPQALSMKLHEAALCSQKSACEADVLEKATMLLAADKGEG